MTALSASTLPAKRRRDEDFPVLWLLPPGRREAVAALYAFARMADDIADAAAGTAAERLAQLDALEDGLRTGRPGSPEPSLRLRAALAAHGLKPGLVLPLLQAFRQDAGGPWVCADWPALEAYCRCSAVPVGRVLLALAGESHPDTLAAADALCIALQVLNHIADCGRDWLTLGRSTLPTDWFAATACPQTALAAGRTSPALRGVLDRALAHADTLLATAAALPDRLRDRPLRAQAAATLAVARHHRRRLGQGDPLARRIGPGWQGWAAAVVAGLRP